jgi:hypothetical protein
MGSLSGLFKIAGAASVVLLAIAFSSSIWPPIRASESVIESKSSLSNEGADFAKCPIGDRPLPYAGHWNTGEAPGGFTPKWQIERISGGESFGLGYIFLHLQPLM